jgi:hypothetical protein
MKCSQAIYRYERLGYGLDDCRVKRTPLSLSLSLSLFLCLLYSIQKVPEAHQASYSKVILTLALGIKRSGVD